MILIALKNVGKGFSFQEIPVKLAIYREITDRRTCLFHQSFV